jgi:branched-chain amino acid aminotransferase
MKPTQWIWRDGALVNWNDATTHVSAHALHYGSSVFEGIRAYATNSGVQFFRLRDHLVRLIDSARTYSMPLPHDLAALIKACKDVVRENRLPHAYVRPLVYRGAGPLTLDPTSSPVETVVIAWEWGHYLAAPETAIDVKVSSWRRVTMGTLPALAKAGGNYLSSQLIRLEAKRDGYVDGIALSTDGGLSEASGANLFLVRNGVIHTPDAGSSILLGITRDSMIQLAQDLGLEVREGRLPRELLHLADEVFLTGTAAEITGVKSVDRIQVGDGKVGPITKRLQQAFYGLFDGRTTDRHGWLEPV